MSLMALGASSPRRDVSLDQVLCFHQCCAILSAFTIVPKIPIRSLSNY